MIRLNHSGPGDISYGYIYTCRLQPTTYLGPLVALTITVKGHISQNQFNKSVNNYGQRLKIEYVVSPCDIKFGIYISPLSTA